MCNNSALFSYQSINILASISSLNTFDLAFYADECAMGCPGLLLILIDNVLYIGNTEHCVDPLYERDLIKIEEQLPQLVRLIGNGSKVNTRKEYSYEKLNHYYLGMGNSLLINKSYQQVHNLTTLTVRSIVTHLNQLIGSDINICNLSHSLKDHVNMAERI